MEGGTLSVIHEHVVGEMAGPAAYCGAKMLCCRCSTNAQVSVNSRMCTGFPPSLTHCLPRCFSWLIHVPSSHLVSECEAAE